MKLPIAKTGNIVVQNLNDETLIYNLTTNQAFCLNETAAKVFASCDGETLFDELKRRHEFTDDLIHLALDELRKKSLLESGYVSPFAGLSRREVVRRIGLASLIALPVISSIVAPTAAHAASGGLARGATCAIPAQCQSGVCNLTTIPGVPITVPGSLITTPGPPIFTGVPGVFLPGIPTVTFGPPTIVAGPPITFQNCT